MMNRRLAKAIIDMDVLQFGPNEKDSGNPEIHPDIIPILAGLKRMDDVVTNLITTGRRIMLDELFAEELALNPPDVIAFSADDFENVEQIYSLREKSFGQLYDLWRSIPVSHGQRQKAVEAVCAASMLHGLKNLLLASIWRCAEFMPDISVYIELSGLVFAIDRI